MRTLEKDGNSPRTIALRIYALQSYFAFLGMELGVGAPSYPKPLPRWLTEEEFTAVLTEAERPLLEFDSSRAAKNRALFLRAALLLYGAAGLRLTEGCELPRENINPQGYITVRGKGGVEAIVPVEDTIISVLQEWCATHDSEYVFPGRGGGHIHRRTMQTAIHNLYKKVGIKNIRRAVHMLRHSAGAAMRARGSSDRDIQQVLRHADISTTAIYTQMTTEDLRKRLPRRFDHRHGKLV